MTIGEKNGVEKKVDDASARSIDQKFIDLKNKLTRFHRIIHCLASLSKG